MYTNSVSCFVLYVYGYHQYLLQLTLSFPKRLSSDLTLRPAMREAFWACGHTSPGSGNPDKPLRIYPDFATARGRYKLSPPQQVGEPFLFDYMAYHSLRRVEGGWSWKFSPAVFKRDNEIGRAHV